MAIEYIELGEKIISNLTLEHSLNELRERINDVYKDTSEAHINTAIQALNAVPFSKCPLIELHSVLDNLRTACNLLEKSLIKKKRVFFFFEDYELSIAERAEVTKKLGSWLAAQAIVQCLITKGNDLVVDELLKKAYSFYKTSLILYAQLRNDSGYTKKEWKIVNQPVENYCYHEEVDVHYDYSSEERAKYTQLQISAAASWDIENRMIIHKLMS